MSAARSFLTFAVLSLAAISSDELKVLRFTPQGEAPPNAVVTVTFDRPVAGSLDQSINPASVLSIEPRVAGRFEWRDPITVQFVPAGFLVSGTTYTVTVSDSVTALDGSKPARSHRFTFTVGNPRPIGGIPVDGRRAAVNLPLNSRFSVVMDGPVDPARFLSTARIEPGASCPRVRAPQIIQLRLAGQRPISEQDPWQIRESGGWERDRTADSLRRVVTLEPTVPLPYDCTADLVIGQARWTFSTYGPFHLLAAYCGWRPDENCPTGLARLTFSTPVKGGDVLRHVRLEPSITFQVGDTSATQTDWTLEAKLKPRTSYRIVSDSTLRDVFGQTLTGSTSREFQTSGFYPQVNYPYGSLLVERQAYRTLPVSHVNLRELEVTMAAVPDSLEAEVLGHTAWSLNELWPKLVSTTTRRTITVPDTTDAGFFTALKIPATNAARPGATTLTLVRIEPAHTNDALTSSNERAHLPALIQVTDLGVHVKMSREVADVWVAGVSDGKPRAGAAVTLYSRDGQVRATGTTDARGLARLVSHDADSSADERREMDGYVAARLGTDRALARVSQQDYQLSPWTFNVRSAWSDEERLPAAGVVFTERGIYRPGETVYAKAIVRTGPLGALQVPSPRDSIRWEFSDREEGTLRDTIVPLSRFGTAQQQIALPAGAGLGTYRVGLSLKRSGNWIKIGGTEYRVAEYRPPEFLVDVMADTAARIAGDSLGATVQGRYLFGAPMARSPVNWFLRQQPVSPWALDIPGTEGFYLGEQEHWWEEFDPDRASRAEVIASGQDTLDAAGHGAVGARLPAERTGRTTRATLVAYVTDVNRQVVSGSVAFPVHPAAFYIAARPLGEAYFWKAGSPQRLGVLVVRPDGERVPGVTVRATVVRREWHRVQRSRDGFSEQVGEWVSDTVQTVNLRSDTVPVTHEYAPTAGGSYIVSYRATDDSGRQASTSFFRWAVGSNWVPWSDESQFKMDVVPDRSRYSVGDTATVLFASPFTNAEAWITVEREGVLEQRRVRILSGTTTAKFRITEAWAPNAFISILVAKGRTAPPGKIGDAGRPTIRVGYAEVRITPEIRRLAVAVTPARSEYRPADTAKIAIRVTDRLKRGQRSEVTLWAVDEGVLALTGYRTPDPVDLLYRPRALGVRLGSNLTAVAQQILTENGQSIKGGEPGGGGGGDQAEILRSRFAVTAFFLGSIVTDSIGRATASVKLPDNLTTFRVMAVAVTNGDRYGSGQSPMLVTRPLLARPALPRFLRYGDSLLAGVVVNQRLASTPTVSISATATGISVAAPTSQAVTLAGGRGSEVRFGFHHPVADSTVFRFDVASVAGSGQGERDAVESRLPTRPEYTPRAHAISGVLRDTAQIEIPLPEDLDHSRSRLEISIGHSPLVMLRQARRYFRVYPYDCSEQISSEAWSAIAALRIERTAPQPRDTIGLRREIETAVATLARRQRADGGIGLWSADDWTTPWLSSHAGEMLAEARALGFAVGDSVIHRLTRYFTTALHNPMALEAPVIRWYEDEAMRLRDRLAAADLLSQFGAPDVGVENDLLRVAAQLTWEDRARLAEVLGRRGQVDDARRLLQDAWSTVQVEGHRAVLPEAARRPFYFPSEKRSAARLLTATLLVAPQHPGIGPLIETLVLQGQVAKHDWWNTQDYGAVVRALSIYGDRTGQARGHVVTLVGADRTIARVEGSPGARRDTTISLGGLVGRDSGETGQVLRLSVQTSGVRPEDAPAFYAFTVHEIPLRPSVTPDQQGIQVERWYEDYETHQPIISAPEGSLVRVRLRVKVTAQREFLVLDDPLPAGLEAVDLSLRTAAGTVGPGLAPAKGEREEQADSETASTAGSFRWYYGSWEGGWWSPFDHRELRDDRVVYVATELWPGTYTATYVARATTPGVFVRPPAHAEEMYNPSVQGRSDGGVFTVTQVLTAPR